jgi:hypothetical protein
MTPTRYHTFEQRGLLLRELSAHVDRINPDAARIILSCPEAFGGLRAGLVQWAISRLTSYRNRRRTRRAA